jgi:hypothetical protein
VNVDDVTVSGREDKIAPPLLDAEQPVSVDDVIMLVPWLSIAPPSVAEQPVIVELLMVKVPLL